MKFKLIKFYTLNMGSLYVRDVSVKLFVKKFNKFIYDCLDKQYLHFNKLKHYHFIIKIKIKFTAHKEHW